MAASTEDIHELRQNVAALSKDLSVIKSMLFTLSNNLHPRPGSGASMRSLAFGAAPPNRRPMHMAHRERPAGSNVLDSVDTFPHDSSDDERHALESVHTSPTPASTALVPPHHEPEETAPNPLLITSVTTSKASPLSKPSHVLPATRRLSIDTATTMRKHSSRVLARNDESSSPSADTTVEAGHEAAPQTAFSATLKGPATSGGPAENNVRRVGFRGEDFIIVTVDVLFILSVTVSWLGAIFYTINGINGPESELVDTFIGLLVLSQIYSWIWIASRFFVQERRGDWEVLESLADIRQEYLSFWFKFDALLALPIDWIFLGWQPQIFFYCQLRHILKVVRYLTITTGSNPLVERRGILTLLAPLMGMVCIIHTAASVVCALNQYDYIPALYWAAVTMSSVGYGDKNATDTTHRVFGIIVIVLGVALVTAVTAVATSMLTAQDAVKLSVDAKKNLLNSMMNHYHVPWAVQLEVIGAFPTALENGNQEQFKALIENLPPFIVEKLTMYIRAKVVSDAIPSFQKCPVDVLLAVASRLLHRFIQANEAIVNVGEEGTEMYFLVRGVADVVIQLPDGGSVVVATLRSGTFFGEIALVTENCRRTASVYAEVLCELLVLNKVDFEELAAQYQEVKEFFGKVIEEAASRAKASGNAKNTSTTPVTASS